MHSRITLVIFCIAMTLPAPIVMPAAVAQDLTVAARFEEAARADTVEAFMTFIASAPTSDEAKRAYDLLDGLLAKQRSQVFPDTTTYKRGGLSGCSGSYTQIEALNLYRLAKAKGYKGDLIPQPRCTQYEYTQVFRNALPYPVYLRQSKNIIVEPGEKHTVTGTTSGERCSGPSIALTRGAPEARYNCLEPKKVSAEVRLMPLLPEEAAAYRAARVGGDLAVANEFLKKYPHGSLASALKSDMNEWGKAAAASAKDQVTVSVQYDKGVSRAHNNDYYLYVKNDGAAPVLTQVGVEGKDHWTLVGPAAYVAIRERTEVGKEANYKLYTVVPTPPALPRYLYADNGKGKIVLLEFDPPAHLNEFKATWRFKEEADTRLRATALEFRDGSASSGTAGWKITWKFDTTSKALGGATGCSLEWKDGKWWLTPTIRAAIPLEEMSPEQAAQLLAKYPSDAVDQPRPNLQRK